MKGLHAPAEELGDLGQLLDPDDVESELLEGGGGPSAGNELEAELDEAAGEVVQAGLVVAGDEGSLSDGLA
jgi:hypothetical protein